MHESRIRGIDVLDSLSVVAPMAVTFALGDVMDMQSKGINAPTLTKVASQVWLVFRGGHHYAFINGDAMDLLTVTLSAAALSMFEQFDVTAEDLAKSAAEWALAINRKAGMVDFSTAATDDLQNSIGTILKMSHKGNAPADIHPLYFSHPVNPTSPSS